MVRKRFIVGSVSGINKIKFHFGQTVLFYTGVFTTEFPKLNCSSGSIDPRLSMSFYSSSACQLAIKTYLIKENLNLMPPGFNMRGYHQFGLVSGDRIWLLVLQNDLLLIAGHEVRAEFEVPAGFLDVDRRVREDDPLVKQTPGG